MNHYVSPLVTDGVCFQAIGSIWIYQPNSSQSFNDLGYVPGRLSTRGTTNTAASSLPHHADASDHLSLLFILDKKGKLLSLFCFFFLGLSKWLKAATGGKRQPFFPLYGPCFPFSQMITAVRNRLLTHRCVCLSTASIQTVPSETPFVGRSWGPAVSHKSRGDL